MKPIMNTHLWQFLLNRLKLTTQNSKAGGFTLIELLVSMLMAGIIVSSLLFMVVNLLKTDQKESANNQTQTEMQSAMDYITSDLRDAVYVYDEVTKLLPYLPNFATTHKPILAFWKAESVAEQNQSLPSNCTLTTFTALQKEECSSLRVRQNTYTLVVYLQSTGEGGGWQGKSRIRRYQLRKYKNTETENMSTLSQSKGYVEPSQTNTSFQKWPLSNIDGTTNLQGTTNRPNVDNGDVLIDFVDDPTNQVAVPNCPSTDYTRTPVIPTPPAANNSTSFFACVRNEINSVGLNQDVVIFLRGNPVGKSGIFTPNQLPTLQSQVIARGVLDKTPPQ